MRLFLLLLGIALLSFPAQAQLRVGTSLPINFPQRFLPYDSEMIYFTPVGGQVFVSNAPESIWPDGATRPDGSQILGQVNSTLYRDTVTGPFRFWASHHNKAGTPLRFWIHLTNPLDQEISFYRSLEGYAHGGVTQAASNATILFMRSTPQKTLLFTIPPKGSIFFSISKDVPHDQAMVYIAEFSAEDALGNPMDILVSHVVTDASVQDPTPYATTPTIARTNATASQSDDYRGLLKHWGRRGTLDITLDYSPLWGIRIADQGYTGEQEPLLSRWDTHGNPIEQSEVRFITPTLNRLRLAYWYTDYELEISITNKTSHPRVHTLYGSVGYNPGFVNYQLQDNRVRNVHFGKEHAVLITSQESFTMRTMIMPSAYLPFGLYFVAGDDESLLGLK